MKRSKVSLENLRSEPVQLPLKGFIVEKPNHKEGWKTLIEGMGGDRIRVHMVKNKK